MPPSLSTRLPTLPGILEVFSRPRLGPFAQRYGFRHIAALDRDLGWDASRPEDVRRLWELIRGEEPWIIAMPLRARSCAGFRTSLLMNAGGTSQLISVR